MEFPEWLEKCGIGAGENNQCLIGMDEIREEYRCKKYRFGTWRLSERLGFFDDRRPQFARFNKIARLEFRDYEKMWGL